MNNTNVKGQVISGSYGQIMARQKSDADFEIGEILIAEDDSKHFLQVYDIRFSSQISQQNLELISGMHLEDESGNNSDSESENMGPQFIDGNLRNYKIALLKNLLSVKNGSVITSKSLPKVFSTLRTVNANDLSFLGKPKNPLFLGNLRSGTQSLNVPIYIDGRDALTHHVLISGTTGKGKSVLMTNLLIDVSNHDYAGILVLDPHDEYFSKLSDSIYYSKKNVSGSRSLKINIKIIKPQHFGCLDFSDAQEQAMNVYYREYGDKWIESILLDKNLKISFNEATINVLKRRLMYLLDIDFNGEQVFCNGVFDLNAGENTIKNICDELEKPKIVIIDTSSFSGQVELLLGSLITTEVFRRYKNYKMEGLEKSAVAIVLEEAPRVLGKDILEKGSNIFSTIAREGRKFGVGIIAITQLPSLIPREILANINTKFILGMDMVQERQAIIDSASQDLSSDSRAIASLDKGECIVSSNFAKFAIPLKIPILEAKKESKSTTEKVFMGVK